VNEAVNLLRDSAFKLVVFYSDSVKELILLKSPDLKIFDATGLENFI